MIPRLYIGDITLTQGQSLTLSPEHSHYLTTVLKRQNGDGIKLFNTTIGEWQVTIEKAHKKNTTVVAEQNIRNFEPEPDIWLCFAPIKKTPIDYLVQKTTELGVQCLQPVVTERTVATRVNLKRLQANCTEAAEQTGRLSIPQILEPLPLKQFLASFPQDRSLLFCDENNSQNPILTVLQQLKEKPCKKWAILIGPEGGFSPAETAIIRGLNNSHAVNLGKRLLRADTAAIAALTCWQAVLGDWV